MITEKKELDKASSKNATAGQVAFQSFTHGITKENENAALTNSPNIVEHEEGKPGYKFYESDESVDMSKYNDFGGMNTDRGGSNIQPRS